MASPGIAERQIGMSVSRSIDEEGADEVQEPGVVHFPNDTEGVEFE